MFSAKCTYAEVDVNTSKIIGYVYDIYSDKLEKPIPVFIHTEKDMMKILLLLMHEKVI